jgi:hypothetical protein
MKSKSLFLRQLLIGIILLNLIPLLGSELNKGPMESITPTDQQTTGIVADHTCINYTRFHLIPEENMNATKETLHIAYQHTSHGSQITTGMTGLTTYANEQDLSPNLYAWSESPEEGMLHLDDYAMGSYADSASDLGYADWAEATRNYLNDPDNANTNVIMWSWCGQVGDYHGQDMLDHYLTPMTILEEDFPNVFFVYMTGHTDGQGLQGDVHVANEEIREYCETNGKILYDFADIESYNPDGEYFGDKLVDDACNYDSNGDGTRDGNWALEWQEANPEGWFSCSAAHSQPLNGNLKAYAAWWLFNVLAGWEAPNITEYPTTGSDPTNTTPSSNSNNTLIGLGLGIGFLAILGIGGYLLKKQL